MSEECKARSCDSSGCSIWLLGITVLAIGAVEDLFAKLNEILAAVEALAP